MSTTVTINETTQDVTVTVAESILPGDNANLLGSGSATDGQVLTANGTGGTAWEDPAGGDITNAAVNTAIATDAAATRTSLGLGSAALLDESDLMASAITRTAAQGSPNVPNYAASTVTVTGTLQVSPGKTVTVPSSLGYVSTVNGKPYYRNPSLVTDSVSWNGTKWILTFRVLGVVGNWESTDNTPTPDLASFTPTGAATGTPSLAISGVTYDAIDAESVGQYCRVGDSSPYDWYIAETAGVGTTMWTQVYEPVTPAGIGAQAVANMSAVFSAGKGILWDATAAATRSNLGITATGDTLATAASKAAARAAIDLDTGNSVTFANVTSTGGTITADTPNTITQTWNNSGVTFTAQKVNVTDTASGASSLLAAWQVGGSNKVSIAKSGSITTSGNITAEAGNIYFNDTRIARRGTGILQLDGTRFQLGGTTSSFPAIKYNGATLESRLADDSDYAPFRAKRITLEAGGTAAGTAPLKFASGSVNTTPEPGAVEYTSTAGFLLQGGLIFKPPASVTPAVNGELTFEATSNTSITVKLKGSDGTVRSVVLTLS